MTDREKVIKAFERCLSTPIHDEICNDCEYHEYIGCYGGLMSDALKLLKEQPEIVRCKDCKFVECEGVKGFLICEISGFPHHPEFYCADGKRR